MRLRWLKNERLDSKACGLSIARSNCCRGVGRPLWYVGFSFGSAPGGASQYADFLKRQGDLRGAVSRNFATVGSLLIVEARRCRFNPRRFVGKSAAVDSSGKEAELAQLLNFSVDGFSAKLNRYRNTVYVPRASSDANGCACCSVL